MLGAAAIARNGGWKPMAGKFEFRELAGAERQSWAIESE
jgi:hypothetical protein